MNHRWRQFLPTMGRSGRTLGGGLRRGPVRPRVQCGFGCGFSLWVLWVELTGLKGQSGDAIVTAIGRNYVDGAERMDFNDCANLAVDRDGLADGGFRGIHVMFLRVELTDEEVRL